MMCMLGCWIKLSRYPVRYIMPIRVIYADIPRVSRRLLFPCPSSGDILELDRNRSVSEEPQVSARLTYWRLAPRHYCRCTVMCSAGQKRKFNLWPSLPSTILYQPLLWPDSLSFHLPSVGWPSRLCLRRSSIIWNGAYDLLENKHTRIIGLSVEIFENIMFILLQIFKMRIFYTFLKCFSFYYKSHGAVDCGEINSYDSISAIVLLVRGDSSCCESMAKALIYPARKFLPIPP